MQSFLMTDGCRRGARLFHFQSLRSVSDSFNIRKSREKTKPWKPHEMADFYDTLIRLKKDHPALWNGEAGGEYVRIRDSENDRVMAFTRVKDNSFRLVRPI
jgi:hypothetical protein